MSNYSQYKITPDKNAAVDLSQTKVRIKASPSFHLAKKTPKNFTQAFCKTQESSEIIIMTSQELCGQRQLSGATD